MGEHILSELTAGVLTLTLNRPDRKNALTRAMYTDLASGIAGADDNPDIRCVLVQAAGDTFTSGNDMADFAMTSAAAPDSTPWVNPLRAALAQSSTPLVAAVNGRAVGVGTTMLLHFDQVLVSDDVQLTTRFVNLALVPEMASSLTLTARIGHARAFSMFVLGEALGARKAVEWGIANAAYSAAELHVRARALAVDIAERPPTAVRITKQLMRDPDAIAERISAEVAHFATQLRSAEAKEALAAFAEKRKPDFSKLR